MKKILLFLLIAGLGLAVTLWLRYGGGEPYPGIGSPAPLLPAEGLEEVLSYPLPIGNVAVSETGRIFFTVHPEARPKGNRVLEYVDGASVPYPDGASQLELFDTVLGIVIDDQQRLWTIDHGNHGLRDARLLGFDLETGSLIHDHVFDGAIAPAGSFLQDLQVSRDGRTIIIADTSLWRKSPALVVYDVASGRARRVLEGHASVAAENFLIRTRQRTMTFLGGILSLKGGVDGIALGDGTLYYGALTGSGLYRVPLADLRNEELPDSQLAARIEHHAPKPLSDGFSLDLAGNLYGTDIEHAAIFRVSPEGELATVLRSERLRWPDGLSFGPDGWLYIADSALADVILRSPEHVRDSGPYRIFRFRPGAGGRPGH